MPLSHLLKEYCSHPQYIIKNIIWRLPKKKSNQNVIFIIGAPRSGTTLVKQILSAHSNIQSVNYENLGVFSFHNLFNINNYAHFLQEEYLIEETKRLLDESSDVIDFFDNFANIYLKAKGGNRFLEKSGITLNRLSFLQNYFPQAKFIHIFRDGRDCYCSALKHPHVYQGDQLKLYAKYWKGCIKARLKHQNNVNIFDIKYEDLTTNPKQVVRKIMLFLGEDYQDNQINPQFYSNKYLSQTEHHKNLDKPINTSSNNKWKLEMTNSDISLFNKIAGKELKQLGYEN